MATKTTIDVGVARPVYKGAWSETADYEYLNIVSNRGCVWMCITDSYAEGDEPIHWYDDETYPDETPPEDPMVTRNGSWVCIAEKGEKGDKGEQGLQGVAGRDGADGEQGPQGTAPAHEWDGSQLRFANPDGTWSEWVDLIGPQGIAGPQGIEGPQGVQGPPGETGSAGKAATITIGTVEMVGPAEIPRVENVGSVTDAILNFKIPKGAKGDAGEQGLLGPSPSISIGTVTTLSAGASATAGIRGETPNLILDLGIPRGATGPQGAKGATGAQGPQGPQGPAGKDGACYLTVGKTISMEGDGDYHTLSLTGSGTASDPYVLRIVQVYSHDGGE